MRLNRIGEDTGGLAWERTLKNGGNALNNGLIEAHGDWLPKYH